MIPELLAGLLLGLFTGGWTARLIGSGLIGAIRCVELYRERRRMLADVERAMRDRGAGDARRERARALVRRMLDAEVRTARVPPWALYPGQFVVSAGLTLALSLLVTEVRALLA